MAAGDTLLIFVPGNNEPTASNPAVFGVRNQQPHLAFDDTTNEYAVFSGVMPAHYGGGGIDVIISYRMASATSGKIRFDAAIERTRDGSLDTDSDSFASAQSVNVDPVPATAGILSTATVAFTDGAQMDSLAVGEEFRLKINRDPADGTNDTASGDCQITKVELREAS